MSKIVTDTALLQLYEAAEFKLSDPINKYLEHPRFRKSITFEMLLTHTSSISDNNGPIKKQFYNNKDSPIGLESFLRDYFWSRKEIL